MMQGKRNSSPTTPTTPRIRQRRKSSEFQVPPELLNRQNSNSLLVNDRNKYQSMLVRAYSSLWMVALASLIVYLGHLYILLMVVIIQGFMVNELFTLSRRALENRRLPGFRRLNWYLFFTAMLLMYGQILNRQLVNTVTSDKVSYKLVSGIIKYRLFICFSLYIAGFVWFILKLQKKMYKYQFGQYAWTHMILVVVCIQSSFIAANIFEGIFWFLLPAILIAVNDVAAYIFGFFFGKTPLIKLSPKKTWEGFIGASITTLIAAFLLGDTLSRFEWMTCPRKDLSTGWLHCDSGPLYKPEYHALPQWVAQLFHWKEIGISPVQWHALYMGLFASVIAPFGGFFASGFKRALKIKDFGDSIPGHGGFTDRMDCQLVMGVFAYIYYQSFVVYGDLSVETVLDQILNNLSLEEQQNLYMRLGQMLNEQHISA